MPDARGTNGFNYNFGIAIARGTVRELALLSGATLSVTAAIYGLIHTANDYENTLKNSRIAFGGYTNAIKAMAFAQQKLLDGKSYFDTDDIMAGMKELQNLGVDAKKNFDLINNMASMAGKQFSETGSAIAAAMRGDESALRDFGIPDQVMKQFRKFQGNTVMMRNAVLSFLKSQKQFRDGFDKTMVSIPQYFKRMTGFVTLFAQAIIGKPTDPNSLLNQVKSTLNDINEFFRKHQKTIVRTGAFIGQVLKFVFKSVAQFIAWGLKAAARSVESLDKFMSNYQHNMMSMLLWMELAKGKVVALFDEYKGAIAKVILAYALFKAAQLAVSLTQSGLAALAVGWNNIAYAIKYARVMSRKFVSDAGKMYDAVKDFAISGQIQIRMFFRRWAAQLTYLRAGNTVAMNSITRSIHKVYMALQSMTDYVFKMGEDGIFNTLRASATSAFQAIALRVASVGSTLSVFAADAVAAGSAFAAGIIPALTGAATAAWGFAAALLANPITWVVIGAVALIAALTIILAQFVGWKTAIATVVDAVIAATFIFAPWIGAVLLLIRYWDKFKMTAVNAWRIVSNVAKLAWINIKDAAGGFFSWIGQKFSWLGSLFSVVTNAFKSVATWAKSLGNGPLGWLLDKMNNLLMRLTDSSADALAKAQEAHGMKVTAQYGYLTPERDAREAVAAAPPEAPQQPRANLATRGKDKLMDAYGSIRGKYMNPSNNGEGMAMPEQTTINVYGAPGQSSEQIAQEVMRKIEAKQKTKRLRSGVSN